MILTEVTPLLHLALIFYYNIIVALKINLVRVWCAVAVFSDFDRS